MKHQSHSSSLFVVASLLVVLILAGCGGAGGSSATAIPTSTIIPTYSFKTQTPVAAIETAVATNEAVATNKAESTSEAGSTSEATLDLNVTLDADMVARGKGRYEALACASCHGANGEGTDKGVSLLTSTLNEGDFIAFMRSGGKLGAAHQYATNKLSITGGAALYQYLYSLRKSS